MEVMGGVTLKDVNLQDLIVNNDVPLDTTAPNDELPTSAAKPLPEDEFPEKVVRFFHLIFA